MMTSVETAERAASAGSRSLEERVVRAADAALAERKLVTPIDVLLRVGWLHQSAVDRWRQGRVDFLEDAISANLARETVRPLVDAVLEAWRLSP